MSFRIGYPKMHFPFIAHAVASSLCLKPICLRIGRHEPVKLNRGCLFHQPEHWRSWFFRTWEARRTTGGWSALPLWESKSSVFSSHHWLYPLNFIITSFYQNTLRCHHVIFKVHPKMLRIIFRKNMICSTLK